MSMYRCRFVIRSMSSLQRLLFTLNASVVATILIALPTQALAAVGVNWQSHTTSTAHGNLNGIAVDVSNLAVWPHPVEFVEWDLSGPDYDPYQLSTDQACVDYSFDQNWTATFSPAATNVMLYCKYWRGPNNGMDPPIFEYTFDQPFTILSGLSNCSVSGNTLRVPSTIFQDGIILFSGPVSAVSVIANNANSRSRQLFTFGLDVPMTKGACCWRDNDGTWLCQELWESECEAVGGTWHGNGVACDDVFCPPSQDIGACCWHEAGGGWACLEMSDADCIAVDGTWHGGTVLCADIDCPDPQERVACCYEDPIYGTVCIEVTAFNCETIEGSWNYGPGSFCSDPFVECPALYPEGACCYEGAAQQPLCAQMSDPDCTVVNGVWYGAGVLCSDPVVLCDPDPELGACCFHDLDAGLSCAEIDEIACDDLVGLWHAAPRCSDPALAWEVCDFSAACCTQNGCVELTYAECLIVGGLWSGLGVACDPSVCPESGVCCLCTGCVPMLEVHCQYAGGLWLGGGACSDCPIVDPTGACCMNLGCATMAESDCFGVGGTWLGAGSDCVACPPPCPADINNDGFVNITEILTVIGAFGPCP